MFQNRNKLNNYTMVDNQIFEILPELKSLAETKVLLYIYRNTMGLIQGTDENGNSIFTQEVFITVRELSSNLNLSPSNVIPAIKSLVNKGYIIKVGSAKKVGYRVRLENDPY